MPKIKPLVHMPNHVPLIFFPPERMQQALLKWYCQLKFLDRMNFIKNLDRLYRFSKFRLIFRLPCAQLFCLKLFFPNILYYRSRMILTDKQTG